MHHELEHDSSVGADCRTRVRLLVELQYWGWWLYFYSRDVRKVLGAAARKLLLVEPEPLFETLNKIWCLLPPFVFLSAGLQEILSAW